MAFELPDLPYPKDALQPYMSAETLTFHHDKHHNAYVTTLNKLVEGTDLAGASLEEIIRRTYGDKGKQAIFNNAGQAWNHNHFWRWMKPQGGGSIPGEIERGIKDAFGDVETFKQKFVDAGVTQFGSGWAWLVADDNGRFDVMKTPNGENPLAHGRGKTLLGVDVWEHSYYIDYRNDRKKYLEAWVNNLVNWDYVAELYGRPG